MSDPQTPVDPKPEIKGASRALFFGSICIVVVFALAIILGAVSVGSGIRHLKKYSADQALDLSLTNNNALYLTHKAEIKAAVALASQGESVDVTLNVESLNAFLAHDPSFESFRGLIRITDLQKVKNDEYIYAETSFPMNKLHWASLAGAEDKFLNGVSLIRLYQKKAHLYVEYDQFQSDGKKIMLDTIESLKEHNSLYFWPAANDYQKELKLVRKTKIEAGTITITFAPMPEDD